jgi:uncharacterized repeat protein (TIGR01451 family)
MRILSSMGKLAWLALGLAVVAGTHVEAQGLGVSVTVSTNLIVVNSNLTYTINLTNRYSYGGFRVFVTNTFPHSAELRSARFTSYSGFVFTNANGFSFELLFNNGGDRASMTVQVRPTNAGLFTNAVQVIASTGYDYTTNVVTRVTNTPSATNLADLAVAVTGPAAAVFTNDWTAYGVSVTNLGPGTATNVFLTNSLPPGVEYKTNSATLVNLGGSNNVIFNMGILTSGAFKNFQMTIVPTNAGPLTFSSAVGANSVLDTNAANNLASNTITVGTFIYGQLIATNASAMNYDPQIGLMTNTIRLTNIGTNVAAATRVIVSGLTNWLYNAAGTNSGDPYVVSGLLAPNRSTNLLLKIFVPTRLAITVTNYTAVITSIETNNIPPVLPAIPTQTVNELALLTVTNTATELNPRATTLGYGLVNPPAGMSISASGIITWTPAQNQSPSTNTIITVVTNSDPSDLVNPRLTATNSFTVIVLEVNTAPALPAILARTVNEQTLLTVTNTATNSNIHSTILGYGLVNPPAGMSISASGIITWTPAQNQSPSTNTIITVVTNSNPYDLVNPRLTATNSFTVVVLEVNTAPVLPAILTRTVNEQTLLTVTNTATNSNIHSTILGYGLVDPPAGMSISASGIITWTPAQNQSPSTNTIITVVTNSNPYDLVNPRLTATNSFMVIVLPFILMEPICSTNGNFQFVFNAGAGVDYTVLYSTNLTDWISIFSFTGAGGWATVEDTNAATSPWRFYRVRINP